MELSIFYTMLINADRTFFQANYREALHFYQRALANILEYKDLIKDYEAIEISLTHKIEACKHLIEC